MIISKNITKQTKCRENEIITKNEEGTEGIQGKNVLALIWTPFFLYFIIRDYHFLDNILCTAMSSGNLYTKTIEQLAWEEEDRTFVSCWNKMASRHWTSRWPSAMSRQFLFFPSSLTGPPRTCTVDRKSKSFECIHTTLESVGGLRVHLTFVRRAVPRPLAATPVVSMGSGSSLSLSLPYLIIIIFIGSR